MPNFPHNFDERENPYGTDPIEPEEAACESGESQKCTGDGATETRQGTPMKFCGPCVRMWDGTHCQHDEKIGYCSTCGEAADEHAREQFHGSSGPVTIYEQCNEAWQQKRGLR